MPRILSLPRLLLAIGISVAGAVTVAARSAPASPATPAAPISAGITGVSSGRGGADPFTLVSVGRGSGGISGSAIWALAWWNGNPQGPGPYVGPPPGGQPICIWHDLGPALSDLEDGLSEASLPLTFWTGHDGGGHPGIWGVDQWAETMLRTASATDHFDLVACPNADQVPVGTPGVESDLPRAHPPSGPPLYVWLFWDTVPDPPTGSLPGIIGEAFDETHLPAPAIGTSPYEVAGVRDSTVVNLPTWLWVGPDIWHTYSATAAGGGYVATVWAVPVSVQWTSSWDFPSPSDDPEGGTTFGPEILDQVCDGPGAIYDPGSDSPQATNCSFDFTQSTFGSDQSLQASVSWVVTWALSDSAGVVGGEGSLGTVVTTGVRPLRVMQVESVITKN
ncbi:MAG: hypothetical protein ABSD78_07415 [Acidimicrobiales bacterium]|jgi:hypothetical protein